MARVESHFEGAFMHDWFHHMFPLHFGSWFVPRRSEGSFKLGSEEPESFS